MTEPSEKFWESVYSRNIGKMIGICYRYTANRQLSEDLAHDAFLKAIDKSAGFKGKGSFDAWIRRIVVNHVLQYIRDQKNRKHVDDRLQHESHVEQPEDISPGRGLSEQTDFSEEELLDAIDNLPEHHRLVFNLYVMDQFTHVQIGEELGISPGTSKSHLARARKKIREILVQKADRKRYEKEQKRGWLLFLFSYKSWSIDQLYRKQFSAFELAPREILSAGFNGIPTVPVPKPNAIISWNYIIATTSAGIILAVAIVVFNAYQRKTSVNTSGIEIAKSAIHDGDSTGQLQRTGRELKENETMNPKNDSSTATFFTDSVIPDKKTKSMKKLDSIGVMFLVSSSIVFDSAAQSNMDIAANSESKTIAMHGQTIDSINDNESAQAKTKKSKKGGTFYASRLFWSGRDNELYFKGKTVVDFEENNFIADGSVNFLGPVYLLIVNDQPVTLNSTIELSQQQYRLARVSNTEAAKKYGEKGRRGAIEISVIE